MDTNWWQTYFNQDYLITYGDILGKEMTKRQVDFVVRALEAPRDASFLDLACGEGRHSHELARRGFSVTGVDYSPALLQKTKEIDSGAKFFEGDMRHLPFKNCFDFVINLMSSFGYFDDERDHEQTLSAIYHALRDSGQFLIDLKNPTYAKEHAQGLRKDRLSDGLTVMTEDTYDEERKRWLTTRRWQENGVMKEQRSSMRVFTKDEFDKLLSKSGFEGRAYYGSFLGESFNERTSPRLIVVAKKMSQGGKP